MHDVISLPFFSKFSDQIQIQDYDFNHGKPGLIAAEISGKLVIIKYWLNRDDDKTEILKEIWLYETRQLHRLRGCPGVGDYISPIQESHIDDHGFYLVLETGSRLPLSFHYKNTSRTLSLQKPWMYNPRSIENRIRLWKNIIRIASAIGILHSQGLLHRHLNLDSILTDPTANCDFQLTGFEWSIRMQRISEDNPSKSDHIGSKANFSFLTDWVDLGYLLANIFKIRSESISNNHYPIEQLIEETELTINELVLIRGLMGVINIDKNLSHKIINSEVAISKIQNILAELNSLLDKNPNALVVAFLFNMTTSGQSNQGKTSIFNAVQSIFFENHGISLSEADTPELLAFIKQDLENPYMTKVCHRNGDTEHLLFGCQLTYIIGKNKSNRTDLEGSWSTAFCHSAYLRSPTKLDQKNLKIAIKRNINCFLHSNRLEIENSCPYSWEEYVNQLETPAAASDETEKLTAGFAAYHLTEIAFAKSEIYPIEILSFSIDEDDPALCNVKLRTRYDIEAEAISQSLSIKSPGVRLKQLFKNSGEYSRWLLLSNSNFNEEDHEISLDFLSAKFEDGDYIYEFTTNAVNPEYKNPFIITSSTQGTISQLGRRAAAIDALSQHDELIALLSSPHNRIMNSHEHSKIHPSYDELDESKKAVFKRIVKTLPLYLVQGPPGVGKTYLVTTLVQQAFTSEPNSRLLLTAQSHSTVHHLYNEVCKALSNGEGNGEELLVISCVKNGSPEDDLDPNLKVDEIAREQIDKLVSSQLFLSSPSQSTKNNVLALSNPGNRSGRSTLVSQLLKSANLVFATTNSKQVEDLIKSNSQFDWSIMEETGKVTGIELLSPLLLSHRRLMIGDHKQLPPYASEVMRKALGNTESLKKSLQFSQEIYNNNIKGEYIKTQFSQENVDLLSEVELETICKSALRLHLLFENLIAEEEIALARSSKHYGHDRRHKPIASMLTIQHRMHPVIAEVISHVFYKKDLDTSEEKKQYYTKANKPFYFQTNNIDEINDSPIIWIETPDVQANKKIDSGDKKPQWHNPYEVKVLINLLKSLRKKNGNSKSPKLALLSPYNKQIEKISIALDRNKRDLRNLDYFSKPDDLPTFCSTVDGFQGAEADLTVVSLARNNSDSYPLSALGILLDSRRMNVLLSRAKHQLVIIGSYEFITHWSKKIQSEEVDRGNLNNEFLPKLVKKLEELRSRREVTFIGSSAFYEPTPQSGKR
ncbi:helicase [Priestia aryabhattai]|nr:helicase [Priestia aryabhattai]